MEWLSWVQTVPTVENTVCALPYTATATVLTGTATATVLTGTATAVVQAGVSLRLQRPVQRGARFSMNARGPSL